MRAAAGSPGEALSGQERKGQRLGELMDPKSWGGRNRRRFFPAMSWQGDEGGFIQTIVVEAPVLNVCSGNAFFGDVRLDAFHPWPDIRGDALQLPFKADSFGAVFMDPPWGLAAMRGLARGFAEALRVAPVLYLYSPIVWGTSKARLTAAYLRCLPGLNHPVVLQRYERQPGAP